MSVLDLHISGLSDSVTKCFMEHPLKTMIFYKLSVATESGLIKVCDCVHDLGKK